MKTFKERSWLFAYFSYVAYMVPRDGINAFAKFGFDATFIDYDGSQVYWLVSDTDLVIVCRGTELTSLNDVGADLDIRLISTASWPGRVHAGFVESVDDVWAQLANVISKFPNRKIWLCGHSLGGAMSTLIGYKLKTIATLPDPEEVYTYGCPKLGNQEFVTSVERLKVPHHRFVNSTDIIPRLPAGSYEHVGTLYYMDKDGRIVEQSWIQSVKDRAKTVAEGDFNFFVNHRITRYANNLYKWMKGSPNL